MVRMADALFAAGKGLDAVRLVLEVASHQLNDWRFSVAAATALLRYTVRYDIVEALLRNVHRHRPDDVLAQVLHAYVQLMKGDVGGGLALFSALMRRCFDERAMICEYMSMALLRIGQPEQTLACLQSYLESGPMTAAILNNLGCALERLNRSAEAIPWYERALALEAGRPEISFGYANTLLKAGRLHEAWPLYFERALSVMDGTAWYLSLPRLRPGNDVAGRRIILFQEQGLGDTIQFIRFVSDLLAKGAEVTILVPRPLVRLLAQSYPGVSVHETGWIGEKERYDYGMPIPDLPYVAGVMSMQEIPAPIPYLRADPGDVARFAAMLPARRPRIGLVWAGERREGAADVLADQRRSTTLAALGAAVTPVDAVLVSLQFGAPRGEIAGWMGQAVCDPMVGVRDMADTAAIVANLDLVISVDTSPLHLAGAMGCPVWLISRWDACWRWGDAGDRSPWYPAMRLFRAQERSFAPVLGAVGAAVRDWSGRWHAAEADGNDPQPVGPARGTGLAR
ncbi:tetratricopeptide repeat protein [Gluconacetobacter takamatsuzukensis]|uniref:Tetratricopeptide repeat protein n=2 Tax=Gluconacetobacter takamatsuzukensis TaxID=1286190 RepID=A0A7W4KB07_9PROT|nr:tetratricopeptide repeat protein [Gluconacetobacter takamatsuzukensis]